MVAEWGPVFRRRVIQPGFFCSFLLQCKVPPTFLYIAAVSASHSDQLLRTLHSTHPFLHYMLIFCSFCCLPSQSQRSDSLLRLCLEALFGAQSRVALPRRGCFQALLSGCTILAIISCSSFALSKIFRWRSTWKDQGAHREGCWFCICLACPKIHGIFALLHKEGVLCIICTVACPDTIKWVTSSSRNVACTATAHSASAQPSAPVLLAFFTVLCFLPCF